MTADSPAAAAARELVLAHGPHLRAALKGRDTRDLAAVVLAADLPAARSALAFECVPSLRVLKSGVALAVVPRDVVRSLAAALDAGASAALDAPGRAGYLWTLGVTSGGGVVVPVGWATAKGGSA